MKYKCWAYFRYESKANVKKITRNEPEMKQWEQWEQWEQWNNGIKWVDETSI